MEPEAVVSIRSGFGVGTNSFYGADVNVDSNVQYLTPQAAALARMAAEAKCGKRDEGWDVRPHPILEPAAPSLQQFEEPGTAPVAVMRNPIAGKQVHTIKSPQRLHTCPRLCIEFLAIILSANSISYSSIGADVLPVPAGCLRLHSCVAPAHPSSRSSSCHRRLYHAAQNQQ